MLIPSSAAYIPTPPFLFSSSTLKFVNVSGLLPGLPAAAAHHNGVLLIAIVGGGVACILALAATAIIVVAMHGRAGLARFVRFCCTLLCSGVLGALVRPGRSLRLKSLALRGIFDRSRRHASLRSKDQADDKVTNEGGSLRSTHTAADHYHTSLLSAIFFSGRSSSTRAVSQRTSIPDDQPPSATSVPVEDIVREQVQAQLQTSVHAYLVELVELRVEKAKEELRQLSVHQRRALETQGHAACQSVDVTDPGIEELRSFNEENGKANEANAISKEASASGGVEDVWIQSLDTEQLSIVEEAVRIDVAIASASSSAETQGAELLAEEGAMLYCKGRLGSRPLANLDNIEADDVEPAGRRQEVVTGMMLLNDAGIASRRVYENQQSYSFTELLQVPEETSSHPASRTPRAGEGTTPAVSPAFHEEKSSEAEAPSGNHHGLALIPTTGTGSFGVLSLQSIDCTLTNNDRGNHLVQNNNMLHHDICTSGVFASSMDQPSVAHHRVYAPLHHDYHNNLMHQQHYNPSSRCQSNFRSDAQFSMVHIAQMPTTNDSDFIRRSPRSSCTDDYGGPFDGVV